MNESRSWETGQPADGKSPPTHHSSPFVIALCELRAPIAVPQPRSGELRGFEFFIHREMYGERELFTLCMGFFASREEAERKVQLLRATYRDAHVKNLREQTVEEEPHPGTVLSDNEVIRVLEARPRVRVEPDEVSVAAPRSVVHELVLPTRPAQIPAKKVTSTAPAASVTKLRKERDPLEETLNELRKFAFDLESDDTGSTTGVRHLQVDFDNPLASRKPRGPRR